MDTSRLLSLAPVLADEISADVKVLQPLRDALKGSRLDELVRLRADAEQYLRAAPSMQFVPSWLHLVRRIGGRSLHAREILRRLGNILDDDDLKPAQKGALVESIESDLADFARTIRQMETALRAINESTRTIAADKAELGVLYPEGHFGDFEEFTREVAELNRHIRPLVEVTGDLRTPTLSSLETGTFEVFLAVGTATGAVVATIVWRLLRTWKQIEEIRKLRSETRKVDAEASELLEKRAQRHRDEAVERIHKEIMGRCDESIDETRKNELSISVKQSIAYMDARIQVNVLFEVSPSEMPIRQTPTGEREAKETKLIRERGAVMWEVQASMARPLLPVPVQEEAEDEPSKGGA